MARALDISGAAATSLLRDMCSAGIMKCANDAYWYEPAPRLAEMLVRLVVV